MSNLCAICPKPGACCRVIVLNGGSFPREAKTIEEAQVEIDAEISAAPDRDDGRDPAPMPFKPLYRGLDGKWRMWCPNLDLSGRCSDYANRPYACRSYTPGVDCGFGERPF